MKTIKSSSIIGIIFVLAAGSLAHFLYQWSEKKHWIGLLCPVNESTWEHMKLVFFPMLFYSLFLCIKWKNQFRPQFHVLAQGILIGTFLIPVLFYTYTGILGFHVFLLDLLTFGCSVIAGFSYIFHALKSSSEKITIVLLLQFFSSFFPSFFVFSPISRPPSVYFFLPMDKRKTLLISQKGMPSAFLFILY